MKLWDQTTLSLSYGVQIIVSVHELHDLVVGGSHWSQSNLPSLPVPS